MSHESGINCTVYFTSLLFKCPESFIIFQSYRKVWFRRPSGPAEPRSQLLFALWQEKPKGIFVMLQRGESEYCFLGQFNWNPAKINTWSDSPRIILSGDQIFQCQISRNLDLAKLSWHMVGHLACWQKRRYLNNPEFVWIQYQSMIQEFLKIHTSRKRPVYL